MKFFTDDDFLEWGNDASTLAGIANIKLAERGKVVFGGKFCLGGEWSFVTQNRGDVNTHRAILVCVEEIEKDSAEKVLRDWVKQWDTEVYARLPVETFIERARKVLGRES